MMGIPSLMGQTTGAKILPLRMHRCMLKSGSRAGGEMAPHVMLYEDRRMILLLASRFCRWNHHIRICRFVCEGKGICKFVNFRAASRLGGLCVDLHASL